MENKTKKNPMTYLIFIFLLVVLIVVIILAVNSYRDSVTGNVINTENSQQKNTLTNTNAPVRNCKDIQVPYDYVEEYQETVPYTTQKCETKDLVYSATNEKGIYSTCNKQSEVCYEKHWYGDSDCHQFCSDKSLSYSVDINNLDKEQGSWTVNINFYRQGSLYKTVPINQFLYPMTTKTFNSVIKLTADSPNGDANQDYSANYGIKYIPTKQVCRDVTDYKEVTKTRIVTRYRIAQKCE